jgi:hypothetical protein
MRLLPGSREQGQLATSQQRQLQPPAVEHWAAHSLHARLPPAPAPPRPQGTLNLVSVAKRAGVKRFVLVTSIGADDNFNFLNLFWGVGTRAPWVAVGAAAGMPRACMRCW